MPAYLNSTDTRDVFQSTAKWLSGVVTTDMREQSARHISIGLINNMPDGALEATERQFLSLLDAASGNLHIRLLLYSLPGISRKGAAASHVRTFYSGVENLWNTRLDGLIVTGREPLAPSLTDEPYWDSFTEVLDWARENTYSTVWSCLAAHAAVLYSDGIDRVRSRSKHCGIFECSRTADHALAAGLAPSIRLPHSRWNGVAESALRRCGYRVLTRSSDVGADIFVKEYKSLFIFFQGHPEYEADTLLLEYRRDVGRYLRGESDRYPSMPMNYFDEATVGDLKAFEDEAMHYPRRELLADVYEALLRTKTEATWRSGAVHIYSNWLEYIATQKQGSAQASRSIAERRANREPVLLTVAAEHTANTFAKGCKSAEEHPRRVASAR
jgi:homoserine O-succinyltransferase